MLGSGWGCWQCWGAQEEGETNMNWRRAQEGAGGLGEDFSRVPTCRFHWWKQARLSVWARSRTACLCCSWGESMQWAVGCVPWARRYPHPELPGAARAPGPLALPPTRSRLG